jgi:hypothetical protein
MTPHPNRSVEIDIQRHGAASRGPPAEAEANYWREQQQRGSNHEYMARPGGGSGGPCGGLEERRIQKPNSADHAGLTHTKQSPRKPGWFITAPNSRRDF